MNTQKIHSPSTRPVQDTTATLASDLAAEPMGAPTAESAATFERGSARTAYASGDSRVVSPAGGGTGEINNQAAIDGHSKKEGDFTEPRTVGGKQLFFTPEGARALDAWLTRSEDNSAPLRAEKDPSFWQRFFQGDPFAGRELHGGRTK